MNLNMDEHRIFFIGRYSNQIINCGNKKKENQL